MPPSSPDPRSSPPQVLRGWRAARAHRRQERPRLDPGDRRQHRDRSGAVLLAAEAALRAGAGKLQVATVASLAPLRRAVALPEALVRALPGDRRRRDPRRGGRRGPRPGGGADAVLIGPGMADTEADAGLRRAPAAAPGRPAGAGRAGPGRRHRRRRPACTTSTAGSCSPRTRPRLAHLAARRRGRDRGRPGRGPLDLAGRTQAVVGLGGATSWIAAPDGRLWQDESGSAGLGVSGSGDVRAGITGGLLARGAEPAQAAVWAAYLHGRAGERLASSVGRLGFLARELPPEIPARASPRSDR